MTVKYGKFELPAKIKVDESARKAHFCRFIAEPFERGFGHTVGNVLRRILLTSMEAPAIISIRIEGVPHEYMAIEGIIEDMTHVVLNFKAALLRKLPTEEENVSREPRVISKTLDITGAMLDKHGGHYVVTLKDIVGDSDFDLVTPEHPLFTVTKPMVKKIDVKIGFGRGYVPSERHVMKEKVVDEIIVDTAFSPVRLVNYYVENTRVGQDTDFDRLILEVTTDGRISPEEALSFATQIGIFHLQVFEQLKKHAITFDSDEVEINTDRDTLLSKLALKINEIELSVRSTNCLSGASIETIGELVIMPESEMLKFRNFGKKSLNEIKAKLEEMGLSLGMDLSRFGITRDNVKQIIIDYLAEKGASKEV
ncbi:MAG TPA: DNA-directed RNA polymerase subunit alpha [Rhabdochlamydiaceae bacterium]|jgi:DNA-directed RNA polymerase subunit alpha|nr:DNA-directed RNA polymerase subunit alpha [Rhabdochlamydiaceae bacterium]